MFGICSACQVFAVTLQDKTLILFLQQNQDVLQEECVQL